MKKTFYFILFVFIFSCSSTDEEIPITNPTEFTFKYNIHSSLPSDWTSEFYVIMKNLENLIPIKASNHFYELPIYAWLSSTDKPFKDKIGDASGASISGNGASVNGKYMVLEIPWQEFEGNKSMHRYSVIDHEYFHVYQMSLSKNFFDRNIELKWMSEGGAATFESLYIQQYYSFNYFKEDQNRVDIAVINTPNIFETYNASKSQDSNYSSSVFMVLALAKELQKNGSTESEAFKLILTDYWLKNPTDSNWKAKFLETFNISVDQFYTSLKGYTNNIETVLPSESLKLESIFKT
tara:strand:- start:1182 stop:2063 length:882 start_codon:yes stop_codon:yes gene_type:complete